MCFSSKSGLCLGQPEEALGSHSAPSLKSRDFLLQKKQAWGWLGRIQQEHVLGAGSLAAGGAVGLVLVLFLPGVREAWSDPQTSVSAPGCPTVHL